MIIKRATEKDYDYLVNIWYHASIEAHHFIPKEFLLAKKIEMKEKYLPESDTLMIEDYKNLLGFVSMVDDYLAALYIDVKYQKRGYGKRLLDYVKLKHDKIHLNVYKKNESAVNFYLRNGFMIKKETTDEMTKEDEYVMFWHK